MLERLFKKKNINIILSKTEKHNGLRISLSSTNPVALGIGAIVGTGIFVITGTAAANYAGPALTISFIISALGCVIAGLCYAEFASMFPVAGSVNVYSFATMDELLAWFIGWVLILEYLFACSSVAVGWPGYMTSLLDGWGIHLPSHIANATFDYVDGSWIWTGSLINFPAIFIIGIIAAFLIGRIRHLQLLTT